MIFNAFQIKNYRSIIDSLWNTLAGDNITVLIGQNESGKTSVLEALYSYYTGNITEDVLRSDYKMPEIRCRFQVHSSEILNYIDNKRLPDEFLHIIQKMDTSTLSRKWENLYRSKLTIIDAPVNEYYAEKERKEEQKKVKIGEEVKKILSTRDTLEKDRSILLNKRSETEREHKELMVSEKKLQRTIKKCRKPEQKKAFEADLTKVQNKIMMLENQVDEIIKELQQKDDEAEKWERKVQYAEQYNDLQKKLKSAEEKKDESYKSLLQIENKHGTVYLKKVKGEYTNSLQNAGINYEEAHEQYLKTYRDASIVVMATEKILNGDHPELAEREAEKEVDKNAAFYTNEQLADELFTYIPVFEFFEDFSSLLPNRIDLTDLLESNSGAEGIKAAKNFLTIAGLDADFFRQSSNRLLKQKMEDLNKDITVNFQEYWRQSIGKDNKINLCFELEHYDYTHPVKSGQPYVEFWIKDKNERLYPKQRSRGVRWFLSFYLELKAYAARSDKKRVILIDEPGLSLHARAQEDVLKVFEDIKDDLQIVYSTHSPHLINIDKTYRLLAVQRADEKDDKSGTIIIDSKSLTEASADTLSPIYTHMGTRVNDQQFIQKKNNVIVEDIATYYYFSTLYKMGGYSEEINFLPATDVKNVTTIANLLTGWKLNYIVVIDDNDEGRRVYNHFKVNIFNNDETLLNMKVYITEGFRSVEDLFSTIDFKKYILNKKMGITESNSEYIDDNNLSRPLLASDFMNTVQSRGLTLDSFDEETRENVKRTIDKIISLLLK